MKMYGYSGLFRLRILNICTLGASSSTSSSFLSSSFPGGRTPLVLSCRDRRRDSWTVQYSTQHYCSTGHHHLSGELRRGLIRLLPAGLRRLTLQLQQ